MKYGYLRVSTGSQNNEKFMSAMDEAEVPRENIVQETISGTKPWRRRALGDLFESLSPGDQIFTPELSRLGRGAADLLALRDAAITEGIDIVMLKENIKMGPNMTAADKMIVGVIASVVQMERDYLSERTREGLAHARAKGKKLGGPRRKGHRVQEMTDDDPGQRNGGRRALPCRDAAIRAIKAGNSISGTAQRYGVSRATIHRWLRAAQESSQPTQVSTAQA